MIASFQLIALLVNEYFTPEWQKEVRYITREVVAAMSEVDKKQLVKLGNAFPNMQISSVIHCEEMRFPNHKKFSWLTSSISGNAFPKP